MARISPKMVATTRHEEAKMRQCRVFQAGIALGAAIVLMSGCSGGGSQPTVSVPTRRRDRSLPPATAGPNLYVVNYVFLRGSVTVYAPGSTSVLRTISEGVVGPD